MCTRPRAYSDREFKKILKKNNYTKVRCKGDHFTYSNGERNITITPNINKVVALRLIKQYNLMVDF